MRHMSHVIVTCHMSSVPFFFFLLPKVELEVGGSVINTIFQPNQQKAHSNSIQNTLTFDQYESMNQYEYEL